MKKVCFEAPYSPYKKYVTSDFIFNQNVKSLIFSSMLKNCKTQSYEYRKLKRCVEKTLQKYFIRLKIKKRYTIKNQTVFKYFTKLVRKLFTVLQSRILAGNLLY